MGRWRRGCATVVRALNQQVVVIEIEASYLAESKRSRLGARERLKRLANYERFRNRIVSVTFVAESDLFAPKPNRIDKLRAGELVEFRNRLAEGSICRTHNCGFIDSWQNAQEHAVLSPQPWIRRR